jgi:hypothetical protein
MHLYRSPETALSAIDPLSNIEPIFAMPSIIEALVERQIDERTGTPSTTYYSDKLRHVSTPWELALLVLKARRQLEQNADLKPNVQGVVSPRIFDDDGKVIGQLHITPLLGNALTASSGVILQGGTRLPSNPISVVDRTHLGFTVKRSPVFNPVVKRVTPQDSVEAWERILNIQGSPVLIRKFERTTNGTPGTADMIIAHIMKALDAVIERYDRPIPAAA